MSDNTPPDDELDEPVMLWLYDLLDVREITDAELSAWGEARHKTRGGLGVVGQLVNEHKRHE